MLKLEKLHVENGVYSSVQARGYGVFYVQLLHI